MTYSVVVSQLFVSPLNPNVEPLSIHITRHLVGITVLNSETASNRRLRPFALFNDNSIEDSHIDMNGTARVIN